MNRDQAIALIKDTNYTNFNEMAMRVLSFQSEKVLPFQLFQRLTGFRLNGHVLPEWIPFLPISLFKSHEIITHGLEPEVIYYSSSTSGKGPSRHLVHDNTVYQASYQRAFEHFYGKPEEWCILCLLPGYLEREGSSLIAMAHDLVAQSQDPDSGFFLYDHETLNAVLQKKRETGTKTLLLGVSFALLDFAEKFQLPPSDLVVMETGGMKGRKKEIVRHELHSILKEKLGVKSIHSEYGMTELLSQAYSSGEGIFRCPPWMRIVVREQNDPFSANLIGKRGRICVIDLANVFSCSFIETEDLGIVYEDGSFEVLGRIDHSDLRGCNVMV
ncbi:MAG: long-chain fatty acid--CoA ligase [Bacteroidota bacterium]|nr:long-chain fatty acid--CoA ligase [Bacteroidota bacterium]MDX5431009.1 long-chain fatty acid--CoA ligase [Bacteroidota bacterium]MDX5469760.1 long-chain fatty acid--CoA ligase [Bacteroidota bacterium]